MEKEIFTIGDKTTYGVIEQFEFLKLDKELFAKCKDDDGHERYISIRFLEKVKPRVPLFTSEDGVEVFKDDTFYRVAMLTADAPFKLITVPEATEHSYYSNNEHFLNFSTQNAAKQYILENKPIMVSYKEIENWMPKNTSFENDKMKEFKSLIHLFFRSKINPINP